MSYRPDTGDGRTSVRTKLARLTCLTGPPRPPYVAAHTDRIMPDPSSTVAPVVSPDTDAEPRRRFSENFNDLANRPAAAVGLGNVLDAFGNRAFGALMLLFAAPNMLPLPPGLSAVLGAPLLFVTSQLMLGRPTLWMPRFICRQSIRRDFFALLTTKLSPVLRRAERILRPGFPYCSIRSTSVSSAAPASFSRLFVSCRSRSATSRLPGLSRPSRSASWSGTAWPP